MKKEYILPLLLSAIILFPTIFFPVSTDLSVYLMGAKIISNGGSYFKDFIDMKPPTLIYFFTFIQFFIGKSIIALRTFDYFYQILVIFFGIKILNNLNFNKLTNYFFSISYSLCYISLHFPHTLQAETIIALPLVISIYLILKDSGKFLDYLYLSLCFGLIISFKTSFVIILSLPIIYKFHFKKDIKLSYFGLVLIMIISIGILLFTMIPAFQNPTDFNYIILYLKERTGGILSLPTFKTIFYENGFNTSQYQTLSFYFFFIFGIYHLFINYINKSKKILIVSITTYLVFLISIIMEKNFLTYHYARLLIPFCLLLSIGLFEGYHKIRTLEFDFNKKLLLFVILIFMFFDSPIPKWINTIKLPIQFLKNRSKYIESFQESARLSEDLLILDYLNNKISDHTMVLTFTNYSSYLNVNLKTKNISKFPRVGFCFFENPQNPNLNPWKNYLQKQIFKAEWIIIEDDKSERSVSLSKYTIPENIQNDTIIFKEIDNNFVEKFKTEHYSIRTRVKPFNFN